MNGPLCVRSFIIVGIPVSLVTVVRGRRTQLPHAHQASAGFTFPDVHLARESHMTKTRDSVGGARPGRGYPTAWLVGGTVTETLHHLSFHSLETVGYGVDPSGFGAYLSDMLSLQSVLLLLILLLQ